MKSLLAHATTCCVGVVLGFLFFSHPQDHDNKISPAAIGEADDIFLQKQLADLQSENKHLKDLLIALENNQSEKIVVPHQNAENFSASSTSAASNENKSAELAQHFEQFQKIESLSDYLSSIEGEGEAALYQNLENNFSAEQIDYSWAPDYEQKIQQLIAEHDPFNALAYTSITCKTHRCQIKISAHTAEEANQLTLAFADSITKNRTGVNAVQVLSATDFSRGFLDLYIAKDNSFNAFE